MPWQPCGMCLKAYKDQSPINGVCVPWKINLIILWSCMSHFPKSVGFFFFYWLLFRKLIVFACVWSQDCMHSVIHSACAVHWAASIVTEVYCLDRCRKHLHLPFPPSLCIFISFKRLVFSHSEMFGLIFRKKLTFHSFALSFIRTIIKWLQTFIYFLKFLKVKVCILLFYQLAWFSMGSGSI